jgi:hypothetical protein
VTAPEEVGRIHNVFRDASAGEETSLIGVNERVYGGLQPGGEHFGDCFHNAVLQGDGPELRRVNSGINFGEEH